MPHFASVSIGTEASEASEDTGPEFEGDEHAQPGANYYREDTGLRARAQWGFSQVKTQSVANQCVAHIASSQAPARTQSCERNPLICLIGVRRPPPRKALTNAPGMHTWGLHT